jgi:hypothetical protein
MTRRYIVNFVKKPIAKAGLGALVVTLAIAATTPMAQAQKPSADKRILPLAGITADQVTQTLTALAKKHDTTLDPKAQEESLRLMASDRVDCGRLGLLCRLVGAERVPGIFRAAWAVQARGADIPETMAAFDKAVAAAAQQNARAAIAAGEKLEADINKAIKDKKLDPKDEKQVKSFVAGHAPAAAMSILNWWPSLGLGAGAHIACANKTWSDTSGWPWNWKYRNLEACGGDLWGEATIHIMGWSLLVGFVTEASLAAYAKTICYCVPTSASPLTTTNVFQTHTASNPANNWFVLKTVGYFYTGTKTGSYSANANDPGTVNLQLGPNALPF